MGREDGRRVDEVDEQFRSLMEGLRTTLPGVEVLFGFLLVLPFQSSFLEISTVTRVVYFVAISSAALAIVCLVAPSAHQRVRAMRTGMPRRHEGHVRVATRIANVGTALVAVALGSSLFVVAAVVWSIESGWLAGGLFTVVAAALWFLLPAVAWRDDW
jgi:hypothetical protein